MEEHLKVIVKELCRRVGTDFDKIDFKKSEWFMEQTWTTKEQDDFKDWLMNYLKENKEARREILRFPILANNKRALEKAADWFIFSYGWRQQ